MINSTSLPKKEQGHDTFISHFLLWNNQKLIWCQIWNIICCIRLQVNNIGSYKFTIFQILIKPQIDINYRWPAYTIHIVIVVHLQGEIPKQISLLGMNSIMEDLYAQYMSCGTFNMRLLIKFHYWVWPAKYSRIRGNICEFHFRSSTNWHFRWHQHTKYKWTICSKWSMAPMRSVTGARREQGLQN